MTTDYHRSSSTTMRSFNFPTDLVRQILLRLPIKSILRFKSVSKPWLSIIENQKFISMHTNRLSGSASKSQSSTTQVCLCASNEGDGGGELFKLCEIKWSGGVDGVIEEFRPLPDEFSRKSPQLIGSSNGVLCLLVRKDERNKLNSVILWNPLSNKFQRLPPLPPPPPPSRLLPAESYNYSRHLCTYGFGYDEVNDDYKVLCFQVSIQRYFHFPEHALSHLRDIPEDRAMVYTLKSKTWRSIDNFPIPSLPGVPGVLFRGTLRWICKNELQLRRPLLAFDLSTEEFKHFPIRCPRGHLGILRDCRLCQTVQMMKGYYHIMVVNKWDHNRWTEFKFKPGGDDLELKPRCAGFYHNELLEEGRCLTPIAYVESPKPFVMIYQEGKGNNLFCYDFENMPVIEGEASNMEFSKEVFPYMQTLEFN